MTRGEAGEATESIDVEERNDEEGSETEIVFATNVEEVNEGEGDNTRWEGRGILRSSVACCAQYSVFPDVLLDSLVA